MTQTDVTSEVRKIATQLKGNDEKKIKNILDWIGRNMKMDTKFARKRTRTGDEVLESRVSTGCADHALVFIVLAKASGFSPTFVETIKKDWFQKENKFETIEGHIFVKIKIKKKTLIVDPVNKSVVSDNKFAIYNYTRDKVMEYIPIKEGSDSWAIGIKSIGDLVDILKNDLKVQG